ncbi:Transcription elongation factor, GreA/GreB family [Devosia lucknowensis]|uniref:Transcription elongation factor, GreA/GreB family n=1 Tax=Devosia lucknowensis TaxID=1096929 RepID=A0A1Y6F640_9HYPH|nr:transcription elongation factor GreA [Devosia lucknowensis]SMQ70294.1 Transcription elongation factor, GreA/GreB family [Devosia lucknowensis]
MSVAFTKEDSAETAAETMLPEKPVPSGPNLVTANGLAMLERQLAEATAAYETALRIEDINERRRHSANPWRELRYLTERLRTAQVVPPPETTDTVAFSSRITIERDDGRTQTFTIVGEDEADPKAGTISFASPLARALMGKGVGDVAALGDAEVEIVDIG